MKKLRMIIILVLMLVLLSPSISNAANSSTTVATDISEAVCNSYHQDNTIKTNQSVYFSHCMKVTCDVNTYNIKYYSNKGVVCSNGNKTPYYKIHKNGCERYQSNVCNRGDTRYCSIVMYYDCTRVTNGSTYKTTTTTRPTTGSSYIPSTSTTTTTQAPVNTKLKSLTLSSGNINFNPDVYEYHVTLDSNVNSVSVYPLAYDQNNKIDYSGNVNITNGSVIVVTVSDNNGNTSEYRINITKESVQLSNNVNLRTLSIGNYELIPMFSSNVRSYTVKLDKDIERLNINYELEDTTSSANIIGNENLKNGSQVKIKVTSQSGEESEYTIIISIKKKSSFISVLFFLIIILALGAGGFYIYKKFVSSNDGGGKYEYE